MKKGQTILASLMMLVVFLVILFTVGLPLTASGANTVSASNTSSLGAMAASTTSVGFLVVLFLALLGFTTVVGLLFR